MSKTDENQYKVTFPGTVKHPNLEIVVLCSSEDIDRFIDRIEDQIEYVEAL